MTRVDPRERGGSAVLYGDRTAIRGRSPRARGKPAGRESDVLQIGSIPASAGEALSTGQSPGTNQVDPRERGGSAWSSTLTPNHTGRSPRARGKPSGRRRRACRSGSIPASAGEASIPWWSKAIRWVDPRERGGSSPWSDLPGRHWGRSPRARGKLLDNGAPTGRQGSIPASAGEAPRW